MINLESAADYRKPFVQQEAAAVLQQASPGGGGEVLRAADSSPGGHTHRDHPAALQATGKQTVGAFTQSTAVKTHLGELATGAHMHICCSAKQQQQQKKQHRFFFY